MSLTPFFKLLNDDIKKIYQPQIFIFNKNKINEMEYKIIGFKDINKTIKENQIIIKNEINQINELYNLFNPKDNQICLTKLLLGLILIDKNKIYNENNEKDFYNFYEQNFHFAEYLCDHHNKFCVKTINNSNNKIMVYDRFHNSHEYGFNGKINWNKLTSNPNLIDLLIKKID